MNIVRLWKGAVQLFGEYEPRPDPEGVGVVAFGADPTGTLDSSAAIQLAINSANPVYFPAGTYRIDKRLLVSGRAGLRIYSDAAATIRFSSDKHNAIDIIDSADILISGITFTGSRTETNITINNMAAINVDNSRGVVIDGCALDYGGCLFSQGQGPNDYGMRVIGCRAAGFRVANTINRESIVTGCIFEQPADDLSLDRIGDNGSSHGIYLYAGRGECTITGNIFRNVRVYGVKLSGSSDPVAGVIVSNNQFIDCGGGVVFGADDNQVHANFIVSNNLFLNCGSHRHGWRTGSGVRVFGCNSCAVSGNSFRYTKEFGYIPESGGSAVNISARYQGTGDPTRNVVISGNQVDVSDGVDLGSSLDIVFPVNGADNVEIYNNTIRNVGAIAFRVTNGFRVIIRDNLIDDVAVAFYVDGSVNPVIERNRVIRGANTEPGPQLRTASVAGGRFTDNVEFDNSRVIPLWESGI